MDVSVAMISSPVLACIRLRKPAPAPAGGLPNRSARRGNTDSATAARRVCHFSCGLGIVASPLHPGGGGVRLRPLSAGRAMKSRSCRHDECCGWLRRKLTCTRVKRSIQWSTAGSAGFQRDPQWRQPVAATARSLKDDAGANVRSTRAVCRPLRWAARPRLGGVHGAPAVACASVAERDQGR